MFGRRGGLPLQALSPFQYGDRFEMERLREEIEQLYGMDCMSVLQHGQIACQRRGIAGNIDNPLWPQPHEGFEHRRRASGPRRIEDRGVDWLVERWHEPL